MFEYFRMPVPVTELIKRTAREIVDDDCLGLAAQLAFYFVLAVFPALLFLVALLGFLPAQGALDNMIAGLASVAPDEVIQIIRSQRDQLTSHGSGSILTIGILGALWSSSAAVMAMVDTLNRAYDIEEGRPWWKVRLLAIGLTAALAVFLLIAFTLIVAGPAIAAWLDGLMGGGVFVTLWRIVYWPFAFLMVVVAIDLIYYFAPDADSEWVWISPGSLLATLLWVGASVGFRFYIGRFGTYNATYGTIGAAIVLMLWFYLTGFSILTGAELNAEIDHALPVPSAERQRPGVRKKIGRALQRALLNTPQR
jgi:membrane protein